LKRKLARTFVAMYHDSEAANKAEEEFDRIFVKKGLPNEIQTYSPENSEMPILELMVKVGFAPSNSEARRLLAQGGVTIDNEKITDTKYIVKFDKEMILKVGKRNFIKLTTK